jgi:hypothetical protein
MASLRGSSWALGLALALFGSACGGDGGGDRLSEEEFRTQANAICAEYNQKIGDLGSPPSPEEIPGYVDQVIPLVEDGLAELRALNPPAELEQDYDAMLDETAEALPAARALGEAAANQDVAALQEAIEQGQQADEEADRLAASLGLDTCASDG